MNRKKFLPLIAVLLVAMIAPVISGAQGEIILTVAVPDWMANEMKGAFADFEAAHPGTKVVLKGVEQSFHGAPPYSEMNEYLEAASDYAAQGDVIYMQGPYNLSPEAVRAGFYLDLWPLAQTDPRMAAENFYGPMWESFRWDGGMWAVPVGGSFTLLIYDVDAFDAAGLAYPDGSWTFDQLMNAARTLTTDEIPGILLYESAPLLASVIGGGFTDDTVMPAQPDFDSPAVIEMMNTWRALEEEGVIGTPGPEMDYNIEDVPIRMETMFAILFPNSNSEKTLAGALLPGGRADMNVSAVTVSAGTAYPELSYELAVYFSQMPELQQFMYGNVFARREIGLPNEGPFADLSPEIINLITNAAENAIPFAEKRFGNYVSDAFRKAGFEELDPQIALEEAEQKARENLQIAAGSGVQIAVATPIPTPQLAAGETRLDFALLNVWQLQNEAQWNQALAEFVANDPEVGDVVLNKANDLPRVVIEENDCLFSPYVAEAISDSVLAVGPFMDADPAFDRADLLPGVLDAVMVGGQVIGVPLVIMPNMLWYNADVFEQAGAALPVNGWTVDGFADTLQMLDAYVDTDEPLMQLQTYGNGYLLMLAAAYGGLPLDFAANPPTPNLTDPASVEALRQVLDFAKAGYIQYDELDARGGGGGGGGGGPVDTTPFYTDYLNWMSFRVAQHLSQNSEFNMGNFKMTTYPAGSTYTPLSYGVGAGYISADAPNPAACYRLLSALSQRPDLFMAMPARRSGLNSPEVAALPPDVAAFYADYAAQMDAPNAIIFPDPYRSGGPTMDPSKHLMMMWFNKALDNYVLRDADLESELAQAQDYMTEFLACTDGIEKANADLMNGTPEQISAYYEQFTDCMIAVDPSRAEQFAPTPAP